MESPCTPQGQGRQRASEDADVLQEHPINAMAEQLRAVTISRQKREQTAPTPASQARPRTQRRTMATAGQPTADTSAQDQENRLSTDAQQPAPAAAGAGTASGVTPSRLTCISALRDELSCGICLDICVRPCATPCGHNFCRSCLRLALQHKRQCPHCREVVPPPSRWQPKVNTALWNTIQLLFPQHAAEAPPPTPPGQVQPAGTAAATGGLAGSATSHQRATAGNGIAGRTRGNGATGLAPEPRYPALHYTMAEAVAAVRGATDAAARQPFRPPRRQQPAQQQPPALEPDLVNMLDRMVSVYSRIESQEQQQQQQHQSSQRGRAGRQQQRAQAEEVIQLDDDDELDNSSSSNRRQLALLPGAGHSQRSSRRLAGHPSSLPRRSGRSAAATAAAAAPGADDWELNGILSDLDEDLLMQEAMLLSMVQQPSAATDRASQQPGRGSRRRQPPQASTQQQQQQPQGADELDVLFGRIHSGSSPGHFWASEAAAEEPDWLLMDAAPGTLQQQQQQQRPSSAGANQNSSSSRMGSWMQSRAAAGARLQRLRPAVSASAAAAGPAATATAAAGSSDLDVAALLDDLDDADVAAVTRQGAVVATVAGQGADVATQAAAARRAAVAGIVDNINPETRRMLPSSRAQLTTVQQELRARCAAEAGGPAAQRLQQEAGPVPAAGGDSTMGEGALLPLSRPAAAALYAVAAEAGVVPLAGSAPGRSLQGVAPPAAAAAAPPPAAESGVSQAQELDVTVLSLDDSPEPQPLMSRLARATARQPPQQQRQQHSGAGSSGQSTNSSSNSSGGNSSSLRAPVVISSDPEDGFQEQQPVQQQRSQDGTQVSIDSDDDDFQPRANMRSSRLTAARASSSLAGAAGSRRVVAGLRPTAVRRAARSRAV